MPMAQAKRLCPHALVAPLHFDRYQALSRAMIEILESFSPAVEQISIDEAFVDLTGTERLHGTAERAAREIRGRIAHEMYHRGQLTVYERLLGVEPALTQYFKKRFMTASTPAE